MCVVSDYCVLVFLTDGDARSVSSCVRSWSATPAPSSGSLDALDIRGRPHMAHMRHGRPGVLSLSPPPPPPAAPAVGRGLRLALASAEGPPLANARAVRADTAHIRRTHGYKTGHAGRRRRERVFIYARSILYRSKSPLYGTTGTFAHQPTHTVSGSG
jgi:hypothetical protein